MRGTPLAACAALLVAAWLTASPADAQGRVDLELITEPRVPVNSQQDWMRTLSEVGFDRVQIRNRRLSDEGGIEVTGSEQRPTYRVVGALTAQNTVLLPGGNFSQRDTGRLREWVANLKEFGPPRPGGELAEFGLTVEQFEAVRKDLGGRVGFTTQDADPAEAITAISRNLSGQIVIDPAAKRAIVGSGGVRDELQGLSYGSALAAILRPAGCAMQPRRQAGRVIYFVSSEPEGHIWPIGWPSQTPDGRLVPSLLKREPLQNIELPLAIGLAELHDRVGVPFLLDHNKLALHRIDPATTQVTMQAGNAHYGSVLKTLLFQAGMKYEVRVDEADRPFLWITTVK